MLMRVTTVANGEIEFDVVSKVLVIDADSHLFDEGLGAPPPDSRSDCECQLQLTDSRL